jgi:hypothetical protein
LSKILQKDESKKVPFREKNLMEKGDILEQMKNNGEEQMRDIRKTLECEKTQLKEEYNSIQII